MKRRMSFLLSGRIPGLLCGKIPGMNESKLGMTRRELTALAAAALAPRVSAQTSPNKPLDIAEWSYHWYGVEHATLARGTVCNGMQMYVERWIPTQVRHAYSVVLIHGGYGQGSDWLSGPDGKRGLISDLIEQGYKVYVLDRPGQGRNPYHPFVHGNFAPQAPTFAAVARDAGIASESDSRVTQIIASMGQPMANTPNTQGIWRSRGAMLLDDIGPAVLVTRGDGSVFAKVTAEARPNLVKGIIAAEDGTVLESLARLAPGQESTAGADPHPNRENLGMKLADQGCFWVGVQQKQMPYGKIAMGQMYVQYMIPESKRYPYPVVMVHGGGGQGTHMMGIGGRPGWVHYFVQAGYSVYWLDRPSYGRSPYHPDALGPSHLPNVPPFEGLITSTTVFNTAQWPGPGGMNDPVIDQFMACESGNVSDENFHSELAWRGGVELVEKIGPCILLTHAFGGFFGWGVADRRPDLIKGVFAMEINGNPFAAQLRWGLTAAPIAYDPPVTDISQFRTVERTAPPDSPRPVVSPYKLQAEPVHRWKNLQNIPIGWLTTEWGGGGSPVANVEFLKQAGCNAEMVRLRDFGIFGNGNLMLLEKNNHEVFGVVRDWLDRKVARPV